MAALLIILAGSFVLNAPALAGEVTIWSATLNTKFISGNVFGCSTGNSDSDKHCSETAVLSDDDFSFESVTNTINSLTTTSDEGEVVLVIGTASLDRDDYNLLTLHVGTTSLAFSSSGSFQQTSSATQLRWNSTGLSWSAGDTIQLRITRTVTGTPLTATLDSFDEVEREDGRLHYRFDLKLNEAVAIPFRDMRDHAFSVTNGTIVKAKRIHKERRYHDGRVRMFSDHWRMEVKPDTADSAVAVSLPGGEVCSEQGALCAPDGGQLFNPPPELELVAMPDAALSVSIADASGDEDDGDIVFTVTLSREAENTVEVDFETTEEGTATAGTDFTEAEWLLVFLPGEMSQEISVGLVDDNRTETGGETVVVELTRAEMFKFNPIRRTEKKLSVSISDAKATGTISD